LQGEAATEALKKFAEELEKGEDTSAEKTRNASLIKLARVLIDVIQTDKDPEKTFKTPEQNEREVENGSKTTIRPPLKHVHSHEHPGKKKKTKMHQPSRIGKANQKTKNKETRLRGKMHGRQTKKHSERRAPKKRKNRKTGVRAQKRNH